VLWFVSELVGNFSITQLLHHVLELAASVFAHFRRDVGPDLGQLLDLLLILPG